MSLQVTEVCLKCKGRIAYNELRSHIESCDGRFVMSPGIVYY